MPRFKKGSPEAIKWAQDMRAKQREKALASTNQELINKDELARLKAKAGETTITTTDAQTVEVDETTRNKTYDAETEPQQAESEAEQDLEIEQAEAETEPKARLGQQDPDKNYCASCGAELIGKPKLCPSCNDVLDWGEE